MKLVFLAQTALSLSLKDVFNTNFVNTPVINHGCHCARLSGLSQSAADSTPSTDLDSHCHDWQRARNCAKFSSECDTDDNDYDPRIRCEDQSNPCRKLVCNLDSEFFGRVSNEVTNTDFNITPQCSFDRHAPNNQDRTCCLNSDFEAEFYNATLKTCNNGNVVDINDNADPEPVPFSQADLANVVSELEQIPDLPFTVTRNWRGPNVEDLNVLNGAFIRDQPTQDRKRRDANVRTKRRLPTNYDLREDPECGDLAWTVRDQGPCGSDYAHALASVASHSMCKASRGASQHRLSAMDVMTCSEWVLRDQTDACKGGYADMAMHHFKEKGMVTGGELLNKLDKINYNVGCYPYRAAVDPLDERYIMYLPRDDHVLEVTPECPVNCYPDYPDINVHKPFAHDKKGGAPEAIQIRTYSMDVLGAMRHIKQLGAVLAVMRVSHSFTAYDGGVYSFPEDNSFAGRRAVTVIGFGHDDATGKDYWLCKASLGEGWGENGFFKIERGINANDIERSMYGFVWSCPNGKLPESDGKCRTETCANNQYFDTLCHECPMNAPATSDRSACELRSGVASQSRVLHWTNYGIGSTSLAYLSSTTGDEAGIATSSTNSILAGYDETAYVAKAELRGGGYKYLDATKLDEIQGTNPVQYLFTTDNEGYIINNDGCFPHSSFSQGPIIDVLFTNYHDADIELYEVNGWNGEMTFKTTVSGTRGGTNPYGGDYYWTNTNIGVKYAIKFVDSHENGKWIYVGTVSHRDWLVWNGEVEFYTQANGVVVKQKF